MAISDLCPTLATVKASPKLASHTKNWSTPYPKCNTWAIVDLIVDYILFWLLAKFLTISLKYAFSKHETIQKATASAKSPQKPSDCVTISINVMFDTVEGELGVAKFLVNYF